MHIIGWSKNGLAKRPATKEDIKRLAYSRERIPYDSFSGSINSNHKGEFALFGEISENIQAGTPQTAIDALPSNLRDLYCTNGRFFVGDYAVFRKIDEIEQVLDSDWGSDSDDLKEEGEDFLPDEGSALEMMHNEQRRQADVVVHSYESQIEEAEELGDYTARDILIEKCATELLLIPDDKTLMYSLNSAFCGLGYNGPKEVSQTVDKSQFSDMVEAAELRRTTFEDEFFKLGLCRKKTQIYGVRYEVQETPMSILEAMIWQEEGVAIRPKNVWIGGYLSTIREQYFKDKQIVIDWSKEAKQKARKAFLEEFRASDNPMHCEESLRQELYWRFDRNGKTTFPEFYTDRDGEIQLDKDKKVTKPSKWDNDKAKAFLKMSMTMGQWRAIYQLKDILIRRIDLNYNEDKDRDLAISVLREEFDEIESSEDLGDYVQRANKREWLQEITSDRTYDDLIVVKGENKNIKRTNFGSRPTYTFRPSLIDRISTGDEFRWKRSVRELARKLAPVIIINKVKE